MSNHDIEIDFSNTQADEYSLVPPGKYDVIVEKVTLGQAEPTEEKPNPAPYLNFQLKIADGGENDGRYVFTIASFSEKALGRTKALLEGFGVDVAGKVGIELGDDDDNGRPMVIEPNLVGEPAVATVKIEKDARSGEDRNRVTRLVGKASVQTSSTPAVAGNGGAVRRFS